MQGRATSASEAFRCKLCKLPAPTRAFDRLQLQKQAVSALPVVTTTALVFIAEVHVATGKGVRGSAIGGTGTV
jgi:hypothetical protein